MTKLATDTIFTDLPIDARRKYCWSSTMAWMMNCAPYVYKPYWHTKLIDKKLNQLFDHNNDLNYLNISMPPRTGKTDCAIRYGATRYLAMNPNHNVYVVTYNQTTANDFGREARLIFQQNAPEIFGLDVDPTSRADNKWRVKGHEGGFYAIGWGGPITGKKVHLLVMDDLLKNDEEALSPRIREKQWSWFDGTASQRIQNNVDVRTKVMAIATRWHVDDLIGRLIAQERGGGSMRWEKIVLPALAERGDIVIDGEVVMRKGESLCDELLPKEYLLGVRQNRTRFFWNAVYQQEPVTQDGLLWVDSMFSDDVWVDSWPSRLMYLVVAVDPAMGNDLRRGDYSAIVAVGVDFQGQMYVAADLEKTGPFETNHRLIDFCRKLPMPPDTIAVEANGFQFLAASSAAEALYDADIRSRIEAIDNQKRDAPSKKEDRIAELDPIIRNKDLKFIRSQGTALLVSQLKNFPSRDHDDGPDALEIATWVLSEF